MWDKALELVAQYGPFPVGILIGMWIKSASMKMYFKSSEKEKDSLRKQGENLHDIIESKNERIEKLHDEINNLLGDKK